MKVRWWNIALLCVLLLGAVVVPVRAQDQTGGYTIPVEGTVENFVDGQFKGTLTLLRFDWEDTRLVLHGRLEIVDSTLDSTVIGNIRRTALILEPTTDIRSSCDRLSMALDLHDPRAAGLDIVLDPITLDISTEGSTSNLRGNLLCTVSRLLEKNAAPAGVAALLNQILRTFN
jgi:hypothetical protein